MAGVYVSKENKFRKAWFALLRELNVPSCSRHDLQEVITGKSSTRLWNLADWDKAVAHLSEAFPLETSDWTDWSATMQPARLAGRWVVSATQTGPWSFATTASASTALRVSSSDLRCFSP